MGDGSRQRFLCLVGGKKIKNKIPGVRSCRRHFEDFGCFWTEKLPIWEKNIPSSQHVGGKNKIKLNCQFFFLVGNIIISSEDSSPIEYTENGLINSVYYVH